MNNSLNVMTFQNPGYTSDSAFHMSLTLCAIVKSTIGDIICKHMSVLFIIHSIVKQTSVSIGNYLKTLGYAFSFNISSLLKQC